MWACSDTCQPHPKSVVNQSDSYLKYLQVVLCLLQQAFQGKVHSLFVSRGEVLLTESQVVFAATCPWLRGSTWEWPHEVPELHGLRSHILPSPPHGHPQSHLPSTHREPAGTYGKNPDSLWISSPHSQITSTTLIYREGSSRDKGAGLSYPE